MKIIGIEEKKNIPPKRGQLSEEMEKLVRKAAVLSHEDCIKLEVKNSWEASRICSKLAQLIRHSKFSYRTYKSPIDEKIYTWIYKRDVK